MLLYFLQNEWAVPAALIHDRFGVKAYHHPHLVAQLHESTPQSHLLEMIDLALFRNDASDESWTGTASQLERVLTGENSRCAAQARRLLGHPNTCGTYLARLEAADEGVARVNERSPIRWKITKRPDLRALEAESHRRRR